MHAENFVGARRVNESIHDLADDALHFRGVINLELLRVGAQDRNNVAVPCFVTGLAENPIDDGLLDLRSR
jgi:hypothetical protein